MSDLKKLDFFTLEMSKNHLISTFLRNGRLRVKGNNRKQDRKGFRISYKEFYNKNFFIILFYIFQAFDCLMFTIVKS